MANMEKARVPPDFPLFTQLANAKLDQVNVFPLLSPGHVALLKLLSARD